MNMLEKLGITPGPWEITRATAYDDYAIWGKNRRRVCIVADMYSWSYSSNWEGNMNLKKATFEVLDRYKRGQKFRGMDLVYEVQFLTGKVCYPDTALRHMREYRRKRGREIENVDKKRSVYEVVG